MFTENELLALIECVDCYRGEAGQYIKLRGEIIDLRTVLIKIKALGKDSIMVKAEANSSIEDCK